MKNLTEWLETLQARGVVLRRSGDKLNVNAPHGLLTPADLATLRGKKAAILEWLEHSREKRNPGRPPENRDHAGKQSRDQPGTRRRWHMSEYQLPFWYLENEQPASGMLNIPVGSRISGKLRHDLLRSSMETVRGRHEALRSVVTNDDGILAWRLMTHEELESHPALENIRLEDAGKLDSLLEELAAYPFHLENEPALKCFLCELSATEHVLVVIAHHLAIDGQSLATILAETWQVYADMLDRESRNDAQVNEPFLASGVSTLPPAAPLAETLASDADWLSSDEAEQSLQRLRQSLGDDIPLLEIPADHVRPATRTALGGQVTFTLDGEDWDRFKELAIANRVTGFMAMTALIATTLSYLGGQDEIVIGMPVSLHRQDTDRVAVGLAMNTVAMRIQTRFQESFAAVLQDVRDRSLVAFDNARVPVERVVQAVQPHRDASRTPLYQVLHGFQPDQGSSCSTSGLQVAPIAIGKVTAQTDLAFWYRETGDGLSLVLEYSRDLFEATTADRILEQLRLVMRAVTAEPDAPLHSLPLLSQADSHRLLAEWGKGIELDIDAPFLDEKIVQQSRRTPDDIVVSQDGHALTYAQLMRASATIAEQLASYGAGRGSLVGVMVSRTPELLALLLGVLRTGAAYLPLDPDYPDERLSYMLNDSHAAFLVTDSDSEPMPDAFDGVPLALDLLLSPDRSHGADAESVIAFDQQADEREASDPAYVIYTSGSTGKPKGVVVSHGNLANFIAAMQQVLPLEGDDRMIALTTLSFDIAALELFLPAACGARTEIIARDTAVDAERLKDRVTAYQPTIMQATPATWEMLLATGWRATADMTIISGGEGLPTPLARALLGTAKRVLNLYGPTETTIWSTCHTVTAEDDPVPIGRPIANTQLYVLNSHQQPVPPGSSGELYIGGAGVARGYLERPELTAERFLPDPFSSQPGARMYRSGDRVRFRADGALECLGRMDNQLKLRGYRIEPGEIEAILLRYPEIRRAAVVAKTLQTPAGDDVRLVAYLVLHDGQRLATARLREQLARELPAHMLPQHFVAMDEIPLTLNGKVDRKSLPSPLSHIEKPDRHEPPRTAMEKMIAGIWQELLGPKEIGRTDNFFDLGGHSLLSMQFIARLHNTTGQRLRPRVLVLNTLAEIAASCDAPVNSSQANESDVPPGNRQGRWLRKLLQRSI